MPPSTLSTKPHKTHHHHHHTNHHSTTTSPTSSSLFCRHHSPSATATLDLLILILVLFSGTFLISSYFSYIFHSLSLLLPPLIVSHSSLLHDFPTTYLVGFVVACACVVVTCFIVIVSPMMRSRKCGNPKCKGLKKALEFDLQLQTEECFKNGNNNNNSEFDKLPWKGGCESNPDYDCLRAELRKMAPPNGRAVLLFRAKCGCPVAKLVGWGPKKGRKHKKALSNVAANGDNR